MKRFAFVVTFFSLLLAGCSSNPNAIEPNPRPRIDATYSVDRVWKKGVGEGVGESQLLLRPSVTTQRVVAGDVVGRVYALDRETGKRLWKVKTGDRIAGGFYSGYGKVLYGTREGEAVALALDTGEELWRTRLSGEALAIPVSNGEFAIFQTQDGHVTALSLESGEKRWDYETPVPTLTLRGLAQPNVVRDRLYAGFANAKVVALDINTGSPLWEQRVTEATGRSELERLVDVDSSVIVENGGVFVVTFQGTVNVLDQDSGRKYWEEPMSSAHSMVSGRGLLFVATDDATVQAVSQRSGSVLWKQDALYGRRLTGAAYHQDLVVVGDFEGYLYWLNAEDGSLVARKRHSGHGFASAPVVFEDTLYVLGNQGRLAAYKVEPRD